MAQPQDTLLLEAVLARDPAAVCSALKDGADQDAMDAYGRTTLYLAAAIGHLEMMKLLLAANADMNLSDGDGFTPFHAALKEQHFDAADFLLENGADINAQQGDKFLTPLHMAFFLDMNAERTGRIMYLLEKGADETRKNADGKDVMQMGDDYSRKWPFAGEMVTYIEEFAKSRGIKAQTAKREKLQAFQDAVYSGLKQDTVVRRIQIKPRNTNPAAKGKPSP